MGDLLAGSNSNKIMETVLKFFGAMAIAIILALIFTLPVMLLWNWLMPEIFGLIKISFIQSLGLGILCNFLFKNSIDSNKK